MRPSRQEPADGPHPGPTRRNTAAFGTAGPIQQEACPRAMICNAPIINHARPCPARCIARETRGDDWRSAGRWTANPIKMHGTADPTATRATFPGRGRYCGGDAWGGSPFLGTHGSGGNHAEGKCQTCERTSSRIPSSTRENHVRDDCLYTPVHARFRFFRIARPARPWEGGSCAARRNSNVLIDSPARASLCFSGNTTRGPAPCAPFARPIPCDRTTWGFVRPSRPDQGSVRPPRRPDPERWTSLIERCPRGS